MKKIFMMFVAMLLSLTVMASEPNDIQFKITDRVDSTLVTNNVPYNFYGNPCYATLKLTFSDNEKPYYFDVYEKITKGRETFLLGRGANNINIIRIKNNILYVPIGNHRTMVIYDKNFGRKFRQTIEPIEESDLNRF